MRRPTLRRFFSCHTVSANNGFTLIELLVVTAIIGILVAVSMPAIQAARDAARSMSCKNKLKQLSLAVHQYHDTFGAFPNSRVRPNAVRGPGSRSKFRWGWLALVLPYIDQKPLHDRCDFGVEPGEGINGDIIENYLGEVRCPSEITSKYWSIRMAHWDRTVPPIKLPHANYYMNDEFNGHKRSWSFRDITDGCNNTILLGERVRTDRVFSQNFRFIRTATWAGGFFSFDENFNIVDFDTELSCDIIRPPQDQESGGFALMSYHKGGVHVGLCDGSVRFVSDSIDSETLKRLANPADGETVGDF